MLNTLVIKYAAPCNLNCSYCYEYNHGDDTWKSKPKKISLDVIEEIAKKTKNYLASKKSLNFNIVAHGGEPLLLPPKYLQETYEIFQNYLANLNVNYSMQTNATLINKEYCEIFKKYNIRLGISLDGDKGANEFRVDHKGNNTFERAVKGISILKNNKCMKNISGILSVINPNSNPKDVLDTFIETEIKMVDFLLPFLTHDSLDSTLRDNIKSRTYDWLNVIYNLWINNKKYHSLKIRIFEDALQSTLTLKPKTDWFSQKSLNYLVIESDGKIDLLDHLKVIGEKSTLFRSTDLNIKENELGAVIKISEDFINKLKIYEIPDDCKGCKWESICGGGYAPHRFSNAKDFNNKSFYCDINFSLLENANIYINKNKEFLKQSLS